MTLPQISRLVRNIPDFPKPGIQFKDITPILANPEASRAVLQILKDQVKAFEVDAIVGIESRGFLFGMSLAQALNIPFIPVRKEGKLPAQIYQYSYDLEYGSSILEIHKDALKGGERVLIHDDLLATGGTAMAAAELAKKAGGEIAGFSFLIELEFLSGREKLLPFSQNIHTLLSYQS